MFGISLKLPLLSNLFFLGWEGRIQKIRAVCPEGKSESERV